ncbi:DUF3558 domain-containing protein [Nocardia anaemiae]|uniref:DUF3558 domain-containing protein n=1 Tax=Nocardia anaemiae TaxID=263910 RepID=UPI0007A4965D|nr:DUF3558 domain-containing protein [Nocardia anaemiae]
MVGTAKMPRAAALILGAVLALAGCNNDSVDGTPTPSSTKASASTTAAATTSKDPEAAIWNPCDIPDSAISALGLNTASKDTTVAGVDPTGWKVCGWLSAPKTYNFGILSSEHTLEETSQRSDYVDYLWTTVASHRALQFRPPGATYELTCWLGVEVPHGMVEFKVMNRYGTSGPQAGEPCAEVRRLTEALAQYLPEH